MDYQVFLLSRIRERFDHSGDTREAVVFGVGSTSRIIAGAALIIVAVFCGFAAGDLVMFQQMGFGVAVAPPDRRHPRPLHPDARRPGPSRRPGWYLPRWLGWLPQLTVEGSAASRRG